MTAKRTLAIFLLVALQLLLACVVSKHRKPNLFDGGKDSLIIMAPPVEKDTDNDAIADDLDKCPSVPGLKKYEGCPVPDTDKDGINDELDKCPSEPGIAEFNGCRPPIRNGDLDPIVVRKDSDKDNVPDDEDACPTEAGDATNKGCPIVVDNLDLSKIDSDGDQVPDYKDMCPAKKGTILNNGCPTTASLNPSLQEDDHIVFPITSDQPATTTANNATELRKATLGFSYYPIIPQEETRDFRVTVIIGGKAAKVKDQIRAIEKEALQFTQQNDTSIVCIVEDIEAYRKLKISLIGDSADFTITPAGMKEEQEIDFVNGNNWHWKIRAVAGTPHTANLTLLINAETPDGKTPKLSERQVNIKIVISNAKSFWVKAGEWIGDHLEYLFTTLIIPLGIFIFNKRKKKDRKKTSANA